MERDSAPTPSAPVHDPKHRKARTPLTQGVTGGCTSQAGCESPHRTHKPYPGAPAVEPTELVKSLNLLWVQDWFRSHLRRKRWCR